ncbi:hypothetical protein O3P69_002823 [Scylla paramamosain]|uniref:Uncharacterized protein n=1 Tax=Scylla paramamosain TaxID=85552 RepID=A0AAW0UN99_SCYPA
MPHSAGSRISVWSGLCLDTLHLETVKQTTLVSHGLTLPEAWWHWEGRLGVSGECVLCCVAPSKTVEHDTTTTRPSPPDHPHHQAAAVVAIVLPRVAGGQGPQAAAPPQAEGRVGRAPSHSLTDPHPLTATHPQAGLHVASWPTAGVPERRGTSAADRWQHHRHKGTRKS